MGRPGGVVTYNDGQPNNIVWDLHGASVFYADGIYTAVGFCRRYRNIFLITSPDGIHWDDSDHLEPVAQRDNEGCFNVVWDEMTSQYRGFALSRGGAEEVKIRGSTTDTTTWAKRLIFTCTAPELAGPWTDLEPCLRATADDDEVAQSRPAEGLITRAGSGVPDTGAVDSRPLHAEVHNLSAFRCGQLWIGLAGFLYVEGDGYPGGGMPSDGCIESQMVWSYDGVDWHHADEARTPAIPRSPAGQGFDHGMIIGTAKEPVVDGTTGELHWYYTGATCTHGSALRDRKKCIGRATWRPNGFVSLDAVDETAGFETVALQVPSGAGGLQVEVNADVRGELVVSLLATDGSVAAESDAVTGDDTAHVLRWPGGTAALPAVGGGAACKLRFRARQSQLFTFRFAPLEGHAASAASL